MWKLNEENAYILHYLKQVDCINAIKLNIYPRSIGSSVDECKPGLIFKTMYECIFNVYQ